MKKISFKCLVAAIIASLTMSSCDTTNDSEYTPSRD